MVKAIVPKGKYKGTWFGSVACRSSGSFNINLKNGRIQGINHKYCQTIQKFDGYKYIKKRREMDLAHSPPTPKGVASCAKFYDVVKINYTVDEKNKKIIGEYISKNNVRYRATAKCFATDEYSEDNGKDIVKTKIKIKQLIKCHNEEYKRNEDLRQQLERSERRLIQLESQWIEQVVELIKKGVCCNMKDICPECGSTELIYNDDIALYVCAVCGKELGIYMQ